MRKEKRNNDLRDCLVELFVGLITARDEAGKLILDRKKPNMKIIEGGCDEFVSVVAEYLDMVEKHHERGEVALKHAIHARDRIIKAAMREALQKKQIVRLNNEINRGINKSGTTKMVWE